MTNDDRQPLLEVHDIAKAYGGALALNAVRLTVYAGEVHAVIGENGAGKSTLMKILAGITQPDDGLISLDGNAVKIDSAQTALRLGIAMIHQELNLADNLSVAANIFLGREPNRKGFLNFSSIRQQAKNHLELIGLDISPDTLVSLLPIGKQQLVEIAKAVSTDARVVIMDEPTSSLSQHEAEQLFNVIRTLRDRGVAIIYISHRLGEVSELADRVTVLRDGEIAGELERHEIEHDRMVQLMVGRDIDQFYARSAHAPGEPLLAVQGLRTDCFPQHSLDFHIRAGEIVGLAGLVGAGRTEVLRALFGIDPVYGGKVSISGEPVHLRSPRDAINAGVALVPEDRKQQGLILEMNIRQNIGLTGLDRHKKMCGLLNSNQEKYDSKDLSKQLRIKSVNDRQLAKNLSGGNQQKVVLGKWLAMKPRVLLLDEPTRGVDIGAKQEIYRLMEELAQQGIAVLFVSSEMEEVLSMSDRVLVMHEGRLTGELDRTEMSEEAIMQLATGRSAVA